MSKAEEKANEYAEKVMLCVNHRLDVRDAYWDGYEQAEKDMQIIPAEEAYTKGFNDGLKERLTWEDAQLLHIITEKYMRELDNGIEAYPSSSQELFEEVLRRFYEKKK